MRISEQPLSLTDRVLSIPFYLVGRLAHFIETIK